MEIRKEDVLTFACGYGDDMENEKLPHQFRCKRSGKDHKICIFENIETSLTVETIL